MSGRERDQGFRVGDMLDDLDGRDEIEGRQFGMRERINVTFDKVKAGGRRRRMSVDSAEMRETGGAESIEPRSGAAAKIEYSGIVGDAWQLAHARPKPCVQTCDRTFGQHRIIMDYRGVG